MTMSASQAATGAVTGAEAAIPDNEVLRLLRVRGTVRSFKPDPVPDNLIEVVIAAGQRAPTSANMQAYSIVVVREQQTKNILSALAGGHQPHIAECPVFFALCADLTRTDYACSLHGTQVQDHTLEKGLVASIDASLVGMAMTLAADSLNLGTVMIGAMRNKPLEVAKLLQLPPKVYVVFGLCMGWPKAPPLPKPRQSMSAVVHYEKYDASAREAAIAAYDRELQAYYIQRGLVTPEQAWTEPLSKKLSVATRTRLREELNTLGFRLE